MEYFFLSAPVPAPAEQDSRIRAGAEPGFVVVVAAVYKVGIRRRIQPGKQLGEIIALQEDDVIRINFPDGLHRPAVQIVDRFPIGAVREGIAAVRRAGHRLIHQVVARHGAVSAEPPGDLLPERDEPFLKMRMPPD